MPGLYLPLASFPTFSTVSNTQQIERKQFQLMGFAAVVWPNEFTYAYAKVATEFATELAASPDLRW